MKEILTVDCLYGRQSAGLLQGITYRDSFIRIDKYRSSNIGTDKLVYSKSADLFRDTNCGMANPFTFGERAVHLVQFVTNED